MKLIVKLLNKYLKGYKQQLYLRRIVYCKNHKNQISPENEICSVCGYYCFGKGGIGCIDKPTLCGYEIN